MQVFLSYAAADGHFAKALSSQLAKRGLAVWATEQEILPGDNLWPRIGKALKNSRAMVVLISPDSMRSEYVRHEIEYALGSPNYEGRLFPVKVRPTGDVPWIFKRLKTLDAKQGAAKISESIADALSRSA